MMAVMKTQLIYQDQSGSLNFTGCELMNTDGGNSLMHVSLFLNKVNRVNCFKFYTPTNQHI